MPKLKNAPKTSELNTAYWRNIISAKKTQLRMKVNREVDSVSFYISPQDKEMIITHFVDEHVALLYRLKDKEIVGIRIESFEKSFLPKYGELQKVWKLSETSHQLEDIGDLYIAFDKKTSPVANEITKVATKIARKQGVKLEPVHA